MRSERPAEIRLTGGNASGGDVVRVGDTVRKRWLPTTERTADYLRALSARGIDVPLLQGRDENGRQILDFIPGRLAMDDAPLGPALIGPVGQLVRRIHDASADVPLTDDWEVLIPAESPDLVCHNDLATWNLIIDGDRLVFIDWDGAGPSTRLWDLAHAAISFAHLFPGAGAQASAQRLRAFVAGYDADRDLRVRLPGTMAERARAMHDLLRHSHAAGVQPWASMYVNGHGEHWAKTATYIAEHQTLWRRALQM